MKFTETCLKGAYLIDLEKRCDGRGFFARSFCTVEFEKLGLDNKIVQINNSLSKEKGTLRGIHYQLEPKAESKIVRCIKGTLFDVIVDLRKESKTFGRWFGAELTMENRKMIYIPKGFGHGFVTLEENTEIIYLVTEFYDPEYERGIRWNDPFFQIVWPVVNPIMSEKDSNYKLYSEK